MEEKPMITIKNNKGEIPKFSIQEGCLVIHTENKEDWRQLPILFVSIFRHYMELNAVLTGLKVENK
jgi:hypothetical protein